MNVPFDFVVASYNDVEGTRAVIANYKNSLAAILVEPLLGAAGNIPADHEFLSMLREQATRAGAVLIFDEVKTSRLGPSGLQGQYGVTPDMTSLGKYLGAGLSFGAFGGSAALMDRFDPRDPKALKHAGTFNNNVMSMTGGLAGLQSSFSQHQAKEFLDRTEGFREKVDVTLREAGLNACLSGIGSILSLHIGNEAPRNLSQVHLKTSLLRQIVHMRCLERGLLLTPRGDIFLSLPMSSDRFDEIATHIVEVIAEELGMVLGI